MYNYGSLIDVPIVDETIDERSYEEDIVSNEKEQQQEEITTSVAEPDTQILKQAKNGLL